MRKVDVLIEFKNEPIDFDEASAVVASSSVRENVADKLSESLDGVGLELAENSAAVPLFSDPERLAGFAATAFTEATPRRGSWVMPAKIDVAKWAACERKRSVVKVWPSSQMSYFNERRCNCEPDGGGYPGLPPHFASGVDPQADVRRRFPGVLPHTFEDLSPEQIVVLAAQLASRYPGVLPHYPGVLPHTSESLSGSARMAGQMLGEILDLSPSGGAAIDCRPFQPAVSIDVIRALLGVERVWFDGNRGQNIVVGILDQGINGSVYPVIGGLNDPLSPAPGSASIQSHGSMCAADVLVAAPHAKLMDYPFLGVPNSGGALAMFQAVLTQRRANGTPHITSNSYGFTGITTDPSHEMNNINHPIHRKVREVVLSGAPCFFSAGNCGEPCASGRCQPSGIGSGKSIQASNALAEVITVAAVNSRHERIGYSSQGPSHAHRQPGDSDGFEKCKPDISAYSHFFGNFGPGRPAGTSNQAFDNGTSASCPVAAGVGALLLSAFPGLTPAQLKGALIRSATSIGQPGYDLNTGHGVINAAAAYRLIESTDWSDFDSLIVDPPNC
ncbi:S8 family peptidase [Stieleria varia]|uniref:Subtilisin DY n=1 Tax=Stieleria varia TaxID=2528005 RepID=A0A5C6B3Q8_9BACT|nr:S8 family serine peptidase [Stieleria varia]TWU05906.1 Subtilisin DY [Stieleria varia]